MNMMVSLGLAWVGLLLAFALASPCAPRFEDPPSARR
jgi:hypothetical protein